MASPPSFHFRAVVCSLIVAATAKGVTSSNPSHDHAALLRSKARGRAAVGVESGGAAYVLAGAGADISLDASPRLVKSKRLSRLERMQEQILALKETTTPGLKDFLGGIENITNSINVSIQDENNNDRKKLNDLNDSFTDCVIFERISDDTTGLPMSTLHLAEHEAARSELTQCRAEQAEFQANRTACLALKTGVCNNKDTVCGNVDALNIMCPAAHTGQDVTAYLTAIDAYVVQNQGIAATKKVACDSATTECENYVCPGDENGPQAPDCERQLQRLHDTACMYGEALDGVCRNYESCFDVKTTDFNANHDEVRNNVATRKLELEVVEHMVCLLGAANDDGAFDRTQIATCKVKAVDTSSLDISVTPPDATLLFGGPCPRVTFHRPCTQEYYSQENLTAAEQSTCTACASRTSALPPAATDAGPVQSQAEAKAAPPTASFSRLSSLSQLMRSPYGSAA